LIDDVDDDDESEKTASDFCCCGCISLRDFVSTSEDLM